MAGGVKVAARNQKAFHEYFIDEKFEGPASNSPGLRSNPSALARSA